MSGTPPVLPAPSLKRTMLSGGLWVLFGKGTTVLCTLATQALLARVLDKEAFGNYGAAFSLVSVLSIAAQLGLHQTATRFIAESIGLGQAARARAVLALVYRWALIGGGALFLLLVSGPGAWLIRGVWETPELAASVASLGVWAVLISLQVITSESFRGFKDLRFAALFGGTVTGILNVILLTLIFLGLGSTDLATVIHVAVIAAATSLLIGLLTLYRAKIVPLPREPAAVSRAEVFAVAMPLWIIVLINNLLAHSDRLILRAYTSAEAFAEYAAAAQLVLLVSQPLILINLLVPPFIAELYVRGETKRLERILRSTAALAGVPAFLVLTAFIVFGERIIVTIYTEEFRGGATILGILSVAKLVNVLTGSAGITMTMTGHQNVLLRIALTFSSLTVVGCLLAAPRYGPVGVAWVVSGGTTLVLTMQWLATRRHTGMWTHPSLPSVADLRSLFARDPGAGRER